jgi:hypothetical protein
VIVRALESSCLKAIEASREKIPGAISTRFTKLPPGAHENAPIIEPNGKVFRFLISAGRREHDFIYAASPLGV